MACIAVAAVVGFVLGWVLLPQPEACRVFLNELFDRLRRFYS